MDALGATRRMAVVGITEFRAMLDIAKTGVLRPSNGRHAVAMLRALDAYGPVGAIISVAAAAHGERTALIDERGALSFSELDRRSNALANALRERGLRSGDVVGVLCRNHRGLLDALFGSGKVGATTLLLNTDLSAPQLRGVCVRENVTALIHDAEFANLVSGIEPPVGRIGAGPGGEGLTPLDELIRSARGEAPVKPASKPRLVLLTSGTTGAPKGAPRDIGWRLTLPGAFLNKIPYRSRRAVVIACPMFHAWGLANTMAAIALGSTVIADRQFTPRAVLDALDKFEADALVTIPILLGRLLALGEVELAAHDLRALRIIALSGSALSVDLANRAMDVFGEVVYNLYGSTEVACAAIATPADLRARPGTVGRPPYGTTVRILGDDGHDLDAGRAGRIFVANGAEFDGYTGGGSKEVIDGLMSTGDVGHIDADGYLFVDGRDDEMIVSGGENVYPREIEELLAGHPCVREAAVIGIPDADFGQRLRAYVVASGDLDEDAVRAYVRANLARFKVPREVVIVDELPHNPAGKIIRRELPGYRN